MIPLHRPPFGIGTVIGSSLVGGKRRSLRWLEDAYAEASGCAAVWLPLARAGICWALRATIGPRTKVIGPAFTCPVVHEAMVRSGGSVRLTDPGEGDFLIDERTLLQTMKADYALVLCEVYGYAYDLAQIQENTASDPAVRIIDMAMSVHHPGLCQRLRSTDFAVISFGTRKSMFAGWGGMGFTPNVALAKEVGRLRDSVLAQSTFGLLLQRTVETSLRTAAHYPPVHSLTYGMMDKGRSILVRARQMWPRGRSEQGLEPAPAGFPAAWSDERNRSPEWSLPSTHLDRHLALWNLQQAESDHDRRLVLARRYHENLAGANGILRPRISSRALSHYTVRVNANTRNLLKRRLINTGVNAASMWAFPKYLDKEQYPKAFRTSSEVLNLPLAPWLSDKHVDRICSALIHCIHTCTSAVELSASTIS